MVTMSDGVQLAADVYVPTQPDGSPARGRFPVILSQTPYGKESAVTTQSMGPGFGGDGYYPYLVQRGYIDVVADVRGSGQSGGDFSLFGPREKQDGVELVRWASRLPGSTHRVGLAGSSYLGLNQIFTAALAGRGSPIKAIAPSTVGNDTYRDLAFGGGIPNLEFGAVWEGLRASMTDGPAQEVAPRLANLARFDGGLYTETDTGGPRAFDNDFWGIRAASNYLDRVVRNGVPALITSGWHDVYQRGAVLDYTGLQNAWSRLHRHTGKPASLVPPMTRPTKPTGRYQAVIGPWFHNPATLGLTFQQYQLAWFDRWLKGIPNGIDRTAAPLHAFELGANRWINLGRWPVPQTRARTLYLGPGALTARPGQAGTDTLAWSNLRSPCNAGTDQWSTGLPAYAIAELGGNGDPCADSDTSSLAGALTYTTAPFKQATTLAGPIDATLYLSSSTPESEVVATLDVVSTGGSARQVSSGGLLGSLRALDPRRSWRQDGKLILPWHPYTSASVHDMPAGQLQRLDVELYPTVTRIAPGERLQLVVTSGDTALQPSPVQISRMAGGQYSIELGGAHPSSVTVPTAPAARLGTSRINWGGCNGSC
jgi:putative CocE/NonD family hydrolase